MKTDKINMYQIIVFITFIISCSLVYIAYYKYQLTNKFIQQAIKTEGKIVDFFDYDPGANYNENKTATSYGSMFGLVVNFTTINGEKIQIITKKTNHPPEHNIGKSIELYYLPSEPNNAIINFASELYLASMIYGIVGSILLLISSIALLIVIAPYFSK